MDETLQHLTTLIGQTDDDFAVLEANAETTTAWAEDFVQAFYDILFAYESTAAVFRPDERASREETLRQWYLTIVSGQGGDAFWRQQWIVGLIHIKRHVENAFMIGMASRVQQLFLQKCLHAFPPNEAERIFRAFKRITDVVVGLIAEGYHLGYMEAVADVTGMKGQLIQRMADVAVDRLLEKARSGG